MAYRTTDINNGSQVKFLLGTQADLEPYIKGTSKAVNGTFYLTNDSHRLYVGNKEGKAVPVNEGVTTVDNLTLLQSTYATAHPGEFFYVTDGNILCVCAGDQDGQKKFVQINNNTDSYVETAKTTIAASGSVATISQVLTRNDSIAVNDSFKIATAEGIKVSVSEDQKTLTLTGTTNDNFAFTVTSDGTSSTATAVLALTDSNGDKVEATIKSAKSDLLGMSKDDTGALVLTPKDQKPKKLDLKAAAKGFSATLTNHDDMTIEGTIDPQIKVGINAANQKTVHFVNGIAALDVYAKSEIDAKMLALNAMTYKGLVKSDGNTNQSAQLWSKVVNGVDVKVAIGDTYLFLDDITFTQSGSTKAEKYSAGTLAIAKTSTGGEVNGVLTGTIDWDYVESTNDTDTTYALGLNDKIIQLKEFKGDDTNVTGTIEFANGNNITAAVTNTAKDGSVNAKVVFNHNKLTPATPANTKASQNAAAVNASNVASTSTVVTVLDSIGVDAYGHVNKIQTKEVTLLDTNSTINKFADTVAVASNVATITSGLQLMHGNSMVGTEKTASFKVASNNLTLSAKDNTLTIDLVWGTF